MCAAIQRARRLLYAADSTELNLQVAPERQPANVRLAGQVLLMLTAGRARRQTDAQERIMRSVDNIDALNGFRLGFGRVNLPAALLQR